MARSKTTKPGGRAAERERERAAALAVAAPATCDVAVVGGGAAGLAAAITAAEAGARVVVVERDLSCGRTILATGNGRCNFSNQDLAWDRYNRPDFVAAVCGPDFGADVLNFFVDCGLAWAAEDGRLYPLSRQAASVREVLLARARRAGVVVAAAREVSELRRIGDDDAGEDAEGATRAHGARWRVHWDGGFVAARSVVLASGGGSTIAHPLGLAVLPFEPVLCSLACRPADARVSLEALDGRRAHVVARLLRDGRELAREEGEVLFRGYGLSGIVIFDFSRLAVPGDVIALDLTCGLAPQSAECLARVAGGVAGLVDPVIARTFAAMDDDAAGATALQHVSDLRFVVEGVADAVRAQVTRGGLDVSQFDTATLEAQALPGLFAAGEALDVDGACGGFNLAWAWKSGMVAGAAAASATVPAAGTAAAPAAGAAAPAATAGATAAPAAKARPRKDSQC